MTVVTVVYNGARHLEECVKSVLDQTYSNWEYVIVDNRSTDETPQIARGFAQDDPRIRYERHDEHVDVVASHNRGFRAISDESVYCKFLGADDWLFPECLGRMVDVAEQSPDVGMVGAYRLTGGCVDLVGLPYRQSIFDGRQITADSFRARVSVLGSPTALLYRSDLIRMRQPFYDESFRHADTEAAYWTLMRADFGMVHQVLTFSRTPARSESAVANRLVSALTERLRMLIRYGPSVFPPDEYRQELRGALRRFVQVHAKQCMKPWRWRDRDYREFQRRAIALTLAEGEADRDVRLALGLVRLLFAI